MNVTGGCQCGTVRFRVDGELGEASICHCRMCQKAMGGLFGPFVEAPYGALVWTRGEPRRFQSSNKVRRGFCGDCGTPLTFEYGERHVGLAVGALDRPAEVVFSEQLGSAARHPAFETLSDLPIHAPDEPRAAAHLASIVSYQHPDQETADWTPRQAPV